jgi:hypothetical protein
MRSEYGTRTSGQQVWLLGAAGLIAVLVIGGGWLSWIALSRAPQILPQSDSGLTATAPRDHPPAHGAPELIDGVPWGFDLTAAGAVAAATTAVAVTGQPDSVFDPARFDEVAAVVFTTEVARNQARQVDAARTEFESSDWADQPALRRSYFMTPLAARLVAYDPARGSATVEVWAITVVGVGDSGGAVFTTSTVELEADHDAPTWTITALDSVDGPTPLVGAVASAPGRTRAFLRDALPAVPLPLPAAGQ